LRGPGNYNVDLSMFKDFEFTETWKLQFRVETFNLLNHPQFGNPNSVVDIQDSGRITSTVNSSREIQLALKFSF
jgi:hypothetical protein